jgi:hypothetical protein
MADVTLEEGRLNQRSHHGKYQSAHDGDACCYSKRIVLMSRHHALHATFTQSQTAGMSCQQNGHDMALTQAIEPGWR